MQFTYKITLAFVLMLTGAMFLTACDRTQPVYEVRNQSVPRSLTLSQVETGVMKAGINKGWKMPPVGPGLIRGTIKWKRHSATVRTKYDARSFSILYDLSHRLKGGMGFPDTPTEGKRVIHFLYNDHVRGLQREIETFMHATGS